MKIPVCIKNAVYMALRHVPAEGVTVLMYHSISDNNEFFTVRPDIFRKQMEYLRAHRYHVLPLFDLKEGIEKGTLPGHSVVITFDDGYADNYANAFSVLQELKFPATIFVSSSLIGLSTVGANGSKLDFMNKQMIQEMQNSGLITFGSHAKSHRKLTGLQTEEIKAELSESQCEIESIIHKKVNTLAFPSGKYNTYIQQAASGYYDILCTVVTGKVNINTKILEIPRNSIDSKVTDSQFRGIVNFGRIR